MSNKKNYIQFICVNKKIYFSFQVKHNDEAVMIWKCNVIKPKKMWISDFKIGQMME